MVTQIYADTTPLLEAIAASDLDAMIQQTLYLLGERNAPPAKLGGSAGIAALWGGASGEATGAFSPVGRIAFWIRSIPIGPEPDAAERRRVAPALPLIQGFRAVAPAVRSGLAGQRPPLPEPLLPADVQHPQGPLGGLREAFAKGDAELAERILLGYYATGADYRELLTTLYATLSVDYAGNGYALRALLAGTKVMDMAEWGGNGPAFISWYVPQMFARRGTSLVAEAAARYAQAPDHDLGWIRTRLSIPKEEAAGPQFQRAVMTGDANAACDAILAALRGGATPAGVSGGIALAVAHQIARIPEGDVAGLLSAGQVLVYVHAVHQAMLQTQVPSVWPLLYTAGAAANTLSEIAGAVTIEAAASSASTPLGGLIGPSVLRSVERALDEGDGAAALASARRYVQMGNPGEALAGIIAGVAAMHDISPDDDASLAVLPTVAAACEEYLTLPPALRQGGQNDLLTAAIRLAAGLRGPHAIADRVRAAIGADPLSVN